MNLVPDTNVLLRVILGDDKKQTALAEMEMRKATIISISVSALCELAWVLSQGYKKSNEAIFTAISELMDANKVKIDRPATEAGLLMLQCGGDFADGVIAHEGRSLGAQEFISFDKEAVKLLNQNRQSARLIG